jgi:hypothetical protein
MAIDLLIGAAGFAEMSPDEARMFEWAIFEVFVVLATAASLSVVSMVIHDRRCQ